MKSFLLLLFSSILLASCKEQKQPATIPVINTSANEELVKQYFSYFNQHDFVKMAAMYTDTADFKDPTLGPGIVKQTREQTIKKYTALKDIFPDIKDEVLNIYPSREKNVIVEFVSKGKALDNTTFELPICTIFTIENGKITKDYTYFDNFEE
jgi:ketosteroid isomerase-like protein